MTSGSIDVFVRLSLCLRFREVTTDPTGTLKRDFVTLFYMLILLTTPADPLLAGTCYSR